jgi:hypothetical protein
MLMNRKHTRDRSRERLFRLLLVASLAMLVALAGCSDDDDDDNPMGPGGNDPATQDFDQTTAVAQAQAAAPQGVALVESMSSIATGYDKSEKNYAYNAEAQRWEYDASWSQNGYTYDWFYTVQYLDGDGNPQQNSGDASSAHHTMSGTGSYAFQQGGATLSYDYLYAYDTMITGLNTATRVLSGTGEIGIDYSYSGNGVEQNYTYAMDWETVGDGVSFPASGCPSGTIRYNLDPYHLDLVFDGAGNAVGTLYDGNGNEVSGGGSTHTVTCSR